MHTTITHLNILGDIYEAPDTTRLGWFRRTPLAG